MTEGTSDFSNAIAESTAQADSVRIIHVGILDLSDSQPMVIEASPEHGVREICLDDFIEDVKANGNQRILIKRLSIDFPAQVAIANARLHIGEPYDWSYLPDNGKMYCSELVYESYVTHSGEKIFEAKPMNFKGPDGTIPDFWVNLFAERGEEIPEGVLGTNPHDMSKDDILILFRTE